MSTNQAQINIKELCDAVKPLIFKKVVPKCSV